MKSDIFGALAMLDGLINRGLEYPEAKFRVAIALHMNGTHTQRLQQLYDEQE